MEVGFGFNVTTCLITISIVIILIYLYVDKMFRYWTDQGIESETKLEYLRSTRMNLNQDFLDNVIDKYKRHGRLFGTCFPFPQLWIAEPELLKYILVKDFPIFRNRTKFATGNALLNKSVSFLDDEDWKRIRNLMTPTFTSSRMRKMAYLVKESAESLCKRLCEKAEQGEEFNCRDYLSTFVIDVIASTAFATKINAQDNENTEFVKNAQMMVKTGVSILKLSALVITPKLARYLKLQLFPPKLINYFQNVILKILEERKEKQIRGNDFLQLMMDAQRETLQNTAEDLKEISNELNDKRIRPEHKKMTLDEIIAQSIMFLFAGHDTTTSVLTFFCYQMALNPEWQEKLLKEIDDTWKEHGNIDFDTLSKMPYLDAILNETLRIKNPAVLLTRVVAEDYEFSNTGIKLKKGTPIMIPIHAMHHDPEWFPEPKKFNPERFLPENKNSIKPYTFLPFGEGPRNCIGMRYVIMLMKLCIVHILKDVKFIATEETMKPLKWCFSLGFQIKELILKIEKRNL